MRDALVFGAGAATVGVVWWLRRGCSRLKWVLQGQELQRLGAPVAPPPRPRRRRRSPDEQFVTRSMPAPPSIVGKQAR